MAGSLTPSQYYDNVLNVVSGSDGMHDLQYKAAPATGQTFVRGAVCSLDSNGKLVAGGGTCLTSMPMWAITGVNDFDANGDTGNISGGVVSCFVATGGYEIFTTEYNTAETYAPNTLLHYDETTAGDTTVAVTAYSTKAVIGCVSRGTQTDVYSQSVLYFWPMFIPATKTS